MEHHIVKPHCPYRVTGIVEGDRHRLADTSGQRDQAGPFPCRRNQGIGKDHAVACRGCNRDADAVSGFAAGFVPEAQCRITGEWQSNHAAKRTAAGSDQRDLSGTAAICNMRRSAIPGLGSRLRYPTLEILLEIPRRGKQWQGVSRSWISDAIPEAIVDADAACAACAATGTGTTGVISAQSSHSRVPQAGLIDYQLERAA